MLALPVKRPHVPLTDSPALPSSAASGHTRAPEASRLYNRLDVITSVSVAGYRGARGDCCLPSHRKLAGALNSEPHPFSVRVPLELLGAIGLRHAPRPDSAARTSSSLRRYCSQVCRTVECTSEHTTCALTLAALTASVLPV